MICNLCMKDVDWLILIKEHKREHPMTYITTREICLDCFRILTKQEKLKDNLQKKEKEDG